MITANAAGKSISMEVKRMLLKFGDDEDDNSSDDEDY